MASNAKDQESSGIGGSNAVRSETESERVLEPAAATNDSSSLVPKRSSIESSQNDEPDNLVADLMDALSFGRTKPIASDRPDAEMPVAPFSEYYNMKHKTRGLAVIFIYSEFSRGGPGRRDCAYHDAKICGATFKKLGYEVQPYMNLTKHDFRKVLEQTQNRDHTDCDSLVVVFMSHGGLNKITNQEFIWTHDSMVITSELWKNFTPQKCPSLAGKPKLFFIQACRGEEVDKGVQLKKPRALSVQTDSADLTLKEDYAIPLYADMLMMWASYPGMFAFKSRNHGMNGSVFVHFLTKVLDEDAHNKNLSSMLLRVTREVAVHYESHVPGDGELNKNKQIPQISSTLMREVKFF